MLSFSAFTWNKAPSDPVYGILGENVTLRWSFKTDASHKLHYFTLLKDGMADMIMYSDVTDKVVVYEPYVGSVVLERNATPSFTLINLKSGDVAKYCCKVNTLNAIGGSQGNFHFNCTHLKLLSKAFSTCYLFRQIVYKLLYESKGGKCNDIFGNSWRHYYILIWTVHRANIK